MKKTSVFIIILFIFFSVSLTQEEQLLTGFETGNSLFLKMKSTDIIDVAFSWGYAVGVWDAYAQYEGMRLPEGVVINQLQIADVAKKYIEEHPEERHILAAALLLEVFGEAFPPKKDNQ